MDRLQMELETVRSMGQTGVWPCHAVRRLPDALDGVESTQTHPLAMTALAQHLQALAATHQDEWVALRRHLHANPELSFEEHETMAFVSAQLAAWGVDHETHVTDTGIVATVHGQNPDARLVALRADMDALPIHEANDVPYASTKPGVMHACGHDVHTTSLLGAVQLLNTTRDRWHGTVRCIFQPGEERIPGGAKGMVAAGVLADPSPAHILGQHVYPQLPAGHVGVRGGDYMAAADEIHLTVHGRGGGTQPFLICATTRCSPLRPSLSLRNKRSQADALLACLRSFHLGVWKPLVRPTCCPTPSPSRAPSVQ